MIREVELTGVNGYANVTVKAQTYGDYAVTRWDKYSAWKITHVPTGLSVGGTGSYANLRAIAKRLDASGVKLPHNGQWECDADKVAASEAVTAIWFMVHECYCVCGNRATARVSRTREHDGFVYQSHVCDQCRAATDTLIVPS